MFNTVILLVLARLVRVEPTKSNHEPTSTFKKWCARNTSKVAYSTYQIEYTEYSFYV